MVESDWSQLNRLQLGRYAEYLVAMEFTRSGLGVFRSEVDDRGIDLAVRNDHGDFFEIQVKSVFKSSYVFLQKDKFPFSERLYVAVVRFSAGADPKVWLIPSLAWGTPTAPFSSKDFKGGRSKPEWGLSVAKKHWPILDEFRLERSLPRLLSKMGGV